MILWYQNMEPGRNFSEMQTVREKYWGKKKLSGQIPILPLRMAARYSHPANGKWRT